MLVLVGLVGAACQHGSPPASPVSVEATRGLSVQVLDAQSGGTLPHAIVSFDGRAIETDAEGVATIGPGATPSRLQVEAAGFVPALWAGFEPRPLVVRLRRAAPPVAAQGHIVGSVRGPLELPRVPPGQVRRVFMGTTLPAAQVTAYPGPLTDFSTTASCVLDGTGARPCEVTLRTRVGRQRVYGWVVDGAADAATDSHLVALMLSEPIDVTATAEPARVELRALSGRSLVPVVPRLASLQGDLAAMPVGVPGVKLDDDTGVMLLPSVGGEVLLPRRKRSFAGAGYWMLAEAETRDQGDQVRLRMIARKLSEDGFTLDHWAAAPARPYLRADANGTTLLLDSDAPGVLNALTFTDASGALVADVVLWGAEREVPLPDAWGPRIAAVTLWAMETELPPVAEPLDVAPLQAGASAIVSRTTALQ